MPHAVVIKAFVERETPLHAFQGQTVHGLLHEILFDGLKLDIKHKSNLKPFSTSIYGIKRTKEHMVPPGRFFYMRFTFLEDFFLQVFSEKFTHKLLEGEDFDLTLSGAPVRITHIFVTNKSESPWAGFASYEKLSSKGHETPCQQFTLYFATPTAFVETAPGFPKRPVTLPIPAFVMKSLIKAWQAFSPISIPQEIIPWLEQGFWVKRLSKFETALHILWEKGSSTPLAHVGFKGYVCFSALKGMPEEARACASTLADFAFFSGVGMKTTMGMGMVRRVGEGCKNG